MSGPVISPPADSLAGRKGFQFELRTGASSPQLIDAWRTPDVVTAGGGRLYWIGRLDDSTALCKQLGASADTPHVQLVAAYLERFGSAGLAQLQGRWALAWISAEGNCFVARDPLGGCGLFWTKVPGGVVVSTDWEALFADPRWDRSLNLDTLAAFFSVHLSPTDGASFYQGLSLVAAGTVVELTPCPGTPRCFWQPATDVCWRGSPEQAELEYRERLSSAVRAAVADAGSPALLLSSGLDSSSIAAVAAAAEIPLQSLSWSIGSLPAVDESAWIRDFVTEMRLQWDLSSADGVWPLHQVDQYLPPELGPLAPPLGGLRRGLYQRATELGADVILTGDGGDLLFLGAEEWLNGLLRAGHWNAAWRGLSTERRAGRALRSLLNLARSMVPRGIRTLRRHDVAPWLTDAARERLQGRFTVLRDRGGERRLRALRSGWADLQEVALAPELARMGLQLRHPFRNLRLAEFFLTLPPQLLFQPGQSKRLARRAMKGLLPEATRTAPRRGTLLPLARRFLTDSLPLVRDILGADQRDWHRWVRQDWMDATLEQLPRSGRDGADWLVVWHCVVYELWRQRWTSRTCDPRSRTLPINARGPR